MKANKNNFQVKSRQKNKYRNKWTHSDSNLAGNQNTKKEKVGTGNLLADSVVATDTRVAPDTDIRLNNNIEFFFRKKYIFI